MKYLHSTGVLLIALLLAGCTSHVKGSGGSIAGDARKLIIGKWDQVPVRESEKHLVDRSEYTRDGKYRFWFLQRTPEGLRTLEGEVPADPVNEGPYQFLDDRTFSVTTTNGSNTETHKFTIETLNQNELVIVTDEGVRRCL
jgi:hypothetical protein